MDPFDAVDELDGLGGGDDPFGAVHRVEQDSIEAGRADGLRDGLAAGVVEGREIGVQKGFEIGNELGFYAGCVYMWLQLQQRDSSVMSERAAKGVAALQEMVASFPLYNPHDESLQQRMEALRGRFKAVASLMGCLQDLMPSAPSVQQQQGQGQGAQAGASPAAGMAPGQLSF